MTRRLLRISSIFAIENEKKIWSEIPAFDTSRQRHSGWIEILTISKCTLKKREPTGAAAAAAAVGGGAHKLQFLDNIVLPFLPKLLLTEFIRPAGRRLGGWQ